jgi:hypothetical protein
MNVYFQPKNEQKVSKSRVKINRKKNPPSIQDPKNAYGFEEGANGELVPQAPPDKDPSIGPAYYNTVNIFTSCSNIVYEYK